MYPTTPVLFKKLNLMVGSDVDDDGDERALPVRLGYDPVGEQPAGRLVLPDGRVPTEKGVSGSEVLFAKFVPISG